MLALDYWEAGLCRRCGQHLSDAMDEHTDPDNPASPRRWVAEGPDECHSCKALHAAERGVRKQEGGDDLMGHSVFHPVLVTVQPQQRTRLI